MTVGKKDKYYNINTKKIWFAIVIGLIAFGGWLIIFSMICYALYHGTDTFSVAFNTFGEMGIEFFVYLSFMIISLVFVIYIYRKGVR